LLETIDSYIYTGLSFSTFKFDKVSFLCLKYQLSKFRKRHYFKLIKKELISNPYYNINDASIRYLIKSNINSLSTASLLIDPNKNEINSTRKLLKREVNYCSSIKIEDFSSEMKTKKAFFFLINENDLKKYDDIISSFENKEIIYLEDLLLLIKNNNSGDTLIDEIKIKILQDIESEIFFTNIDIFSNIVNDFVFTLNKIAINL
jgi:hypothetical protein